MSYSDGGRPIRKYGTKSPKKLCVTKNENSDKTTTTINCNNHHHNHYHHNHRFLDTPQPSVHKRNLYIVSFPLILLFNVLRTLLYQLFVVFKYLYTSTSQLIQRRQTCKQTCQLEIVVGQKSSENLNNNLNNTGQTENEGMSQVPRRQVGPGPGDPLLAKQKHHHRRAFEFISKALKIDEDNEGQKEMAIELYKKGIGELEKGIAIECNGGRGEVWEHAQRLHDKMRTNLAMAKDRLDFLVSVCELKKLDICNEYRAPGNKMDNEHPGKNLRVRRNIHTLQTTRSSLNTNHTKNTNSTQTVNIGQNTCTQIPKLRPRSPKNYSAHSEGTVCLKFWAYNADFECKFDNCFCKTVVSIPLLTHASIISF